MNTTMKLQEQLDISSMGELIALFTIESDIGDGWEDEEVHNDPKEKREKALKMGSNWYIGL